eukprot:506507-Hanusia_phi.AAC.3
MPYFFTQIQLGKEERECVLTALTEHCGEEEFVFALDSNVVLDTQDTLIIFRYTGAWPQNLRDLLQNACRLVDKHTGEFERLFARGAREVDLPSVQALLDIQPRFTLLKPFREDTEEQGEACRSVLETYRDIALCVKEASNTQRPRIASIIIATKVNEIFWLWLNQHFDTILRTGLYMVHFHEQIMGMPREDGFVCRDDILKLMEKDHDFNADSEDCMVRNFWYDNNVVGPCHEDEADSCDDRSDGVSGSQRAESQGEPHEVIYISDDDDIMVVDSD